MKTKYDVTKHLLVPKHAKASEKEVKDLLARYSISLSQLPRMLKSDPGLNHLDVAVDDVIKITRPSPITGETIFYRRVVND
ncbi:DNA-directed RNA polymerase subunit H [Candidatus Woesearchaeota archaeon]|nr:DNA-directed RNA polymerase subunit H [Candidatus Woesearchaeota archaeon]